MFYESPEWWLVAATIVLVYVTARLVVFTKKLWGATVSLVKDAEKTSARQAGETQELLRIAKKSADAAKLSADASMLAIEESRLLQRAKITRAHTVCDLKAYARDGLHGGQIIGCNFENQGPTPATVKRLHTEIKVTNGELPPPIDPSRHYGSKVPPRIIALGRAEQFEIEIQRQGATNAEIRTSFLEGKGGIFLLGFVRYSDVFGRDHLHGFCGRYDRSKGDFVIEGGDEYNYSKKDGAETRPPPRN